jgi:hypothetical protein
MSIWLANLVAVLHAGWILLNLAGTLTVVLGRFATQWPLPMWQRLYLLSAVGSSLSAVLHGDCLLTTIENHLRRWSHPANVYDGSFLSHYVPVIPSEVADRVFLILSVAALVGVCQAVIRGLGEQVSKPGFRQIAQSDSAANRPILPILPEVLILPRLKGSAMLGENGACEASLLPGSTMKSDLTTLCPPPRKSQLESLMLAHIPEGALERELGRLCAFSLLAVLALAGLIWFFVWLFRNNDRGEDS